MNRRFKLFHNIAMRAMYFHKTYHKFNIFYKAFALNNCSVNSYSIVSSYLSSILRSCIEISSLSTSLFIDSAMTETVFTEPRKCSQSRTLFGRGFPRNFSPSHHSFWTCILYTSYPYVSLCVHIECLIKSPQRARAVPRLASTWYKTFYNYTLKGPLPRKNRRSVFKRNETTFPDESKWRF